MGNSEKCPCPKTNCKRHGSCDECRAHHDGKKPPYCQRKTGSAAKKQA